MNKELLQKYLNNSCSKEELDECVRFFHEERDSDSVRQMMQDDWKKTDYQATEEEKLRLESVLDKMHHKININQTKKANYSLNSPAFQIFYKVAAVLVLPLMLAVIVMLTNKDVKEYLVAQNGVDSLEVIAPAGSKTRIELSDGTIVSLNYGSSLRYPRFFTGSKRNVVLTGEAFFEVAYNEHKPFFVEAQGLQVKVLGTKFNVKAYANDTIIETVLAEGKVALSNLNSEGETVKLADLKPGEFAGYYKNSGTIISEMVDVEKYLAWMQDKMVFDNATMDEITRSLSRKYNVDFQLSERVKHFNYTLTIIDGPLNQILDLLKDAGPVSCKISPRTKLPNGTLSKQLIVIY